MVELKMVILILTLPALILQEKFSLCIVCAVSISNLVKHLQIIRGSSVRKTVIKHHTEIITSPAFFRDSLTHCNISTAVINTAFMLGPLSLKERVFIAGHYPGEAFNFGIHSLPEFADFQDTLHSPSTFLGIWEE